MEDIEKGVETTELWVERLRIAAVEHYSKHHVPQGLLDFIGFRFKTIFNFDFLLVELSP